MRGFGSLAQISLAPPVVLLVWGRTSSFYENFSQPRAAASYHVGLLDASNVGLLGEGPKHSLRLKHKVCYGFEGSDPCSSTRTRTRFHH
jgi:hypothetical protein